MEKVAFTNNKLLFPNEELEQLFLTYLAHHRTKNNNKNINLCEEELKDFVGKCGEILLKYGASSNFVADIIALNEEIANDTDNTNELEIRRNHVSDELSRFISALKDNIETLVVGEDLERDSNRAFDRKSKICMLEEENSKLVELFPGSESIGPDDIKDMYPFTYIRQAYKKAPVDEVNSEIFVTEQSKVEEGKKSKVVKIFEAPQELVDTIFHEQTDNSTPNDFFSEPTITDSSFFSQDDEIVKSIEESEQNVINDFVGEVPEEQIDELTEPKENNESDLPPLEEKETSIPEHEDIAPVVEETQVESIDIIEPTGEISKEEPPKETNDSQSDETIPFTCTTGISLKNIAVAAYNDESLWKYVYEKNQELIESKNNQNLSSDEIADNKDILDGLVLNIPVSIPNKDNETLKKVA